MRLGRRVGNEIEERVAADEEVAATFRDRLAAAQEAERRLRTAQADGLPYEQLRGSVVAFDQALTEALRAAEAAERLAMGPKTYAPTGSDDKDAKVRRRAKAAQRRAEIAHRKAKARPNVRPWTHEVDRLRTLREEHRVSLRPGPRVAV